MNWGHRSKRLRSDLNIEIRVIHKKVGVLYQALISVRG